MAKKKKPPELNFQHPHKIFQHPFLYLAADTSDVMAVTDPRREQNFRWHNTGLTNEARPPFGLCFFRKAQAASRASFARRLVKASRTG